MNKTKKVSQTVYSVNKPTELKPTAIQQNINKNCLAKLKNGCQIKYTNAAVFVLNASWYTL